MKQLVYLSILLLGSSPLWPQTGPLFDVKHYGATGNGSAKDTAAINKAVAACNNAGGGTVYFPAGRYLSGTIHLKSNVTLWIDSGAVIVGSPDLADYQNAIPNQDWYAALIIGSGIERAGIVGHGLIDGNKVFNPKGEERMRGPHGAIFVDSTDITVRDISFKDAANYALILRSCERVNIDGMTARGGWDGINMHDTKGVTIANCRLFTGDDCLAGAYWENVTVTNCVLNTACNAFRAGGRNVLINNCLIYGPAENEHRTSHRLNMEAGFQILPHRRSTRTANKRVPQAPCDNIVISNVVMDRVRAPFWVAYGSDASYGEGSLGMGRMVVENLTVTNCGRTPFYISGTREDPVKELVLRNVRMSFAGGVSEPEAQGQALRPYAMLQSYGVYLRHIENAEFHNVRVGFEENDSRPALYGQNIGVMELDRFIAPRVESDSPPMLFDGIRRLIIDGAPVRAASVQMKALDVWPSAVRAGEPFAAAVTVHNSGPDGLAEVPLAAGAQRLTRQVFLKSGQNAAVRFFNNPAREAGDLPLQAGDLSKTLKVDARTVQPIAAPYREFKNTQAALERLDGDSFFIRASAEGAVLDRAEQYATVYQSQSLPVKGSVVVKVENPELRGSWGGRAGIAVRNDLAKPGQSPGFLVLGASGGNGDAMLWDSDGDGRIDRNTTLDSYSYWPHWLKLARDGTKFTGYWSKDGKDWHAVGDVDLPQAAARMDAGMFVFSSSAVFSGFATGPQQ